MGEYFLSQKFIRRSFERRETTTKQLLNAGRGHQARRKEANCLQKEAGQNIKDKKRDKTVRDESCPGEGVVKEEKFPNTRKPSHWQVCGEFWNLRGQHNQKEKKRQPTEYAPNCNSQWRSSPDACACQQRGG